MNFATLQGLTIPEGNVTQITDASGNVLWKAGGEFVPLYDFGTVTTKKGIVGCTTTQDTNQSSLGFDLTEPTHMMINGEIFEVVHSGGYYRLLGDTGIFPTQEYPYFIRLYQAGDWVAVFTSYEAGTYTVSLGKYD